ADVRRTVSRARSRAVPCASDALDEEGQSLLLTLIFLIGLVPQAADQRGQVGGVPGIQGDEPRSSSLARCRVPPDGQRLR
ncbi:hypothetical protein PMAYCL1PPCAC_27581, partial [Pristionchus mayeri]